MLVRFRTGRALWGFAAMAAVFSPAGPATEPVPPREMKEIVVTATRLPTPRLKVASSITVITADDIKRRQLRTVPDALRTVPGLHVVQQGGAGQVTSVFTRGANSNQTLVLIDGIRANDPSNPTGQMDLSNLLVDNIDRIEVVRGPQSTLFGSDAIGGVINIITRRGEGPLTGTARAERGSDDTTNTRGGLSGAEGSFDYSASLVYLNTDAHSVTPKRLRDGAKREDDSYRNWTGSGRLGWTPTETMEFGFTGRYINAEKTNIDPELERINSSGELRGTTEDRDAFLESKQYYLRGDGKIAFFDGMWDASVAASYTDYDRDSRNDRQDPIRETLDRTNFEGDRLKFEWKNDLYLFDGHVVTAGLETEKENAKSSGFTARGPVVTVQNLNADDRTSAVYFQDQFSINERLLGTAGFRVDHSDDFGTELTFRIAPVYLHKETRTRFAGSLGTGFKAPSLFERFGSGGGFRGNPNLNAEESLGWELGVDQALFGDRLTFGATYFWSRIEDLIQFVLLPDDSSTLENLNEVHSRGVETYISAQLAPEFSVRVDYTYTKADEDDTDEKLLRRPSHKVNGDVSYKPRPNITLSATASYVARWRDSDRLTFARVSPSSYTVVDLAASYAFNKWVTALARIDNASDETYEPADGFEAAGRQFFGGVQITL